MPPLLKMRRGTSFFLNRACGLQPSTFKLETGNFPMAPHPSIVVGIDVGGPKKGFHAVALRDGTYFDRTESRSAREISDWCHALGACVVAVDAPCRWRRGERARQCERDLAAARISCFATPSRER